MELLYLKKFQIPEIGIENINKHLETFIFSILWFTIQNKSLVRKTLSLQNLSKNRNLIHKLD